MECINDDLGLDLSDPAAIQAKLQEQGVECTGVATVGKAGDEKEQKKNFATQVGVCVRVQLCRVLRGVTRSRYVVGRSWWFTGRRRDMSL